MKQESDLTVIEQANRIMEMVIEELPQAIRLSLNNNLAYDIKELTYITITELSEVVDTLESSSSGYRKEETSVRAVLEYEDYGGTSREIDVQIPVEYEYVIDELSNVILKSVKVDNNSIDGFQFADKSDAFHERNWGL